MNRLPGWSTKIEEISQGVFHVVLADEFSRKAEVTDNATNETIERAINYAFEIEKQTCKNWNKFLYDLCLQNLPEDQITKAEYNDQAFGSWLVELGKKRILLDGKDFTLFLQLRDDENWEDQIVIEKDNLNYFKISDIIATAKKHYT